MVGSGGGALMEMPTVCAQGMLHGMGSAVPGAGCAACPVPSPRRGSASPRRGPATSVYSDFSLWKEKQGPLFRRN